MDIILKIIIVVSMSFLCVFWAYIYGWKEPMEREKKRVKEEERKKRRDEENRREREYRKKRRDEENRREREEVKKIYESEKKEKLEAWELLLGESFGVDCKDKNKDKIDLYGIDFLYHMTDVENLSMVLEHGLLPHNNSYVSERIDNKDVNGRRNRKDPIYGKVIHDYVPFYFNPKNPMLFVNRYKQHGIIILVFSNDLLFREGAIFTNGNAAKNNTKFFSSLDCLGEINWDCIKAEYWNSFENGKSERMAEILVPDRVEINSLCHIICFDESQRVYVKCMAPEIKVIVDRNMYF